MYIYTSTDATIAQSFLYVRILPLHCQEYLRTGRIIIAIHKRFLYFVQRVMHGRVRWQNLSVRTKCITASTLLIGQYTSTSSSNYSTAIWLTQTCVQTKRPTNFNQYLVLFLLDFAFIFFFFSFDLSTLFLFSL